MRRIKHAVSAAEELCALGLADLDAPEHALHVFARDERAHLGLRQEAVADGNLARCRREGREKSFRDAAFEDQPRSRAAHFALSCENREHGELQRDIEVRVGEDDAR